MVVWVWVGIYDFCFLWVAGAEIDECDGNLCYCRKPGGKGGEGSGAAVFFFAFERVRVVERAQTVRKDRSSTTGEKAEVNIVVGLENFSKWVVEKGRYVLEIGKHARDEDKLGSEIEIDQTITWDP